MEFNLTLFHLINEANLIAYYLIFLAPLVSSDPDGLASQASKGIYCILTALLFNICFMITKSSIKTISTCKKRCKKKDLKIVPNYVNNKNRFATTSDVCGEVAKI